MRLKTGREQIVIREVPYQVKSGTDHDKSS